jgi:hypothetical protein
MQQSTATIAELEANDNEFVVGLEGQLPELCHHSGFDPLVAPTAQSGCRASLLGDPLVGAPEHQHLNQLLLEDYSVGDARAMTAERVIRLTTLGQQGAELLPDGLDEVRLECGHGNAPLHREA